uniref:t-SNARE coiled-coil homology domain-containing protein n=1 Tax=Panagrellus redivivus TaxID=6233 RepID=A0A7E4V355_PANRE
MAYRSRTPNGGNSYEGSAYLENQNDNLLDGLRDKVNTLKRVTINIGDDVREQNRLLGSMESDFDASRGLLDGAMKRLGIVQRTGGKNVLCYLVLFSFFVFLCIYYLVR